MKDRWVGRFFSITTGAIGCGVLHPNYGKTEKVTDMKVVLAGNLESAFVRMHDERASPHRNQTGHPYYLDLNRNTDRVYRDAASTFIAIAKGTIVPWELDWGDDAGVPPCAVQKSENPRGNAEWERRADIIKDLLDTLPIPSIFSKLSIDHMTQMDFAGYDGEVVDWFVGEGKKSKINLIKSYLNRLLHQIYASQESGTFLVICEPEIQVLGELGIYIAASKFGNLLPFPDLTSRVIDPNALMEGLLLFSPKDIESVEAVRADKDIQHYAERVRGEIVKTDTAGVTLAAIEAYHRTEAGKKVNEILEVASWVVKPLHYIPGVDAVMSIVEDVKDGAMKVGDWTTHCNDWHMIGVKMQTVSTENYFQRIGNRFPEANKYRKL